MHPLPLTGLDGANPLAFLAALGRSLSAMRCRTRETALLAGRACGPSWGTDGLHAGTAPSGRAATPEGFAEFLAERSRAIPGQDHPAQWVIEMLDELLTDKKGEMDRSIRERFRSSASTSQLGEPALPRLGNGPRL